MCASSYGDDMESPYFEDSDSVFSPYDSKRIPHYTINNWLVYEMPSFEKMIQDKGAAIWLNEKRKICFRHSINSEIHENLTPSALSDLLGTVGYSHLEVFVDNESDIQPRLMKQVALTSYNTSASKEFYTDENRKFCRNLYIPSKFLASKPNRDSEMPLITWNFLNFLMNASQDGVEYFLDKFANHVQTYSGGNVQLVLKGTQPEARNILYEYMLEPLYGENNSARISDEELDKSFLDRAINKTLICIDKLPIESVNPKAIHKQLQKLIKEKADHTMILITTSEIEGLGIERNPGAFTVIDCDNDLAKTNYLGTGSYDNLGQQLKDSLQEFHDYLYYRDVNYENITTALETEAKDLIMSATMNRVDTFVKAIKTKDIGYFEAFNNTVNTKFYLELRENFFKGVVSKAGLTKYVNALEGESFSAKAFLLRLRACDNAFFNDKMNTKGAETGDELYVINSKYNEYYTPKEDASTLEDEVA